MTRSPDEEEDIAYEMYCELATQEQREINRRVRYSQERRRRRAAVASPDDPVADHTREV